MIILYFIWLKLFLLLLLLFLFYSGLYIIVREAKMIAACHAKYSSNFSMLLLLLFMK